MKKNILTLIIISLFFSCVTKKPEKRSKLLKGFSANYNTLFNSKQALQAEFDARTEGHKDNFYAPYISLITYDELPTSTISTPSFGNNEQNTNFSQSTASKNSGNNNNFDAPKGATILEISEAKALKTINKYSVIREGQEENKIIFDAYITLAQARIYMGKPLSALDALNQIFTKMKDDKRINTAKIYQGLAYAKMQDYFKANQIFADLKKQDLDKGEASLLSLFYSESLLNSGNRNEAINELDNGFELQKDRKLKSRIAFLRGQILAAENKGELARNSFLDAYKYANDFEFEVKSQIEIAKTYNNKNDYTGAKEYLEKISKKGTYGSRKNEFYYAIGLMAGRAGKKEESMEYFRKSLQEKVSDPQIRGLDYFEMGKSFLDDNEYIAAGAYYDSALAVMTYEPTRIDLTSQSNSIKKIAKNYYLIRKNDSVLTLANMPEASREAYFTDYISKLKVKEEQLERERNKIERSKGFGDSDTDANSIFANNTRSFEDFGSSGRGFYFANNNTVSKGNSDFKKLWGDRPLVDNWRQSSRGISIADEKNTALGLTTAPDPRRYETSFYTEKIPRDAAVLAALKKDRDTASLGLGLMYQDFFSNTPLATKTLYQLVDNNPEEKILLQALYEVFNMNYKNSPANADRAKQILLTDYPYTSFAEFARNPQNTTFVKSDPAVERAYVQAYTYFEQEKFTESINLINQTVMQYPKDALMPKFALLNAFNTGKTAGKEVMILQLEQIALNYDKTFEGEKAKEMLNYLKSDITLQQKDLQGNTIDANAPVQNKYSTPSDNETEEGKKTAKQKMIEESKNKASDDLQKINEASQMVEPQRMKQNK